LFLQKISQAVIKQKYYLVLLIFFAFAVLISYELTDGKTLPVFFSVFYDSEPDFFSNSISNFLLGYSIDTHHPGDFLYFIGSEVINLFKPENTETLIIYSRKIIFFLGVILTIPLIIKYRLAQALLIILLAFISPEAMYLSSKINPHWLSFFFMAYIIYFSQKILGSKNERLKDHIFLAIFSILSLGIKHTFLIVTIPIYILIMYKSFYKNREKARLSFIYLFLAFIAFLYLIRSVIIAPIYLNTYTSIFLFSTWIHNLLIISIAFAFIFYFFYILYKKRSFIKEHALKIYFIYFKVLAIGTILNLIFYFSNGNHYMNIYESRHFFFLLPTLILLIGNFDSKNLPNILLILFFVFLLIFQIGNVKKYSDFLMNNKIESGLVNNSFNKIVDKLGKKLGPEKDIAIFPTSTFVSVDYFPLWGGYRYGSRFDSNIHNKVFLPKNNLHIFNITKFIRDRNMFKNTLTQRYLASVNNFGDLIKPLKFATHIYEENRGKDLCTQPFDEYHNEDFIVLQIKSNKKSSIGSWPDKYEFSINEFIERLPAECNMVISNLYHGKEGSLEYRFFQVFKK